MSTLSLLVNYILFYIMILISVAFVTLLEQKLLAVMQIRVGPNNVGYAGLFQPFADAVKLFNKESIILTKGNTIIYYMSPILSLSLSLILWLCIPMKGGGFDFNYSLMFFMVVSSVGVFPILGSGWSSNCKYSMLGSLRSVAQMVSYEVSLGLVLLSLIWVNESFNMDVMGSSGVSMIFLLLPLSYIWFVSSLAETNRTPYDFSEGESELVSGFNTEYSSGGFTLIFMAEYSSILFMSVLLGIPFFSGSSFGLLMMFKGMLVACWFIWVRGTMPRYRYDKLMGLAWKSLLPVSLFMFMFYVGVSLL
uniref:NADH-ubiquinone oxidoreductase chain 1 n=1 Tax=Gondogeneia antarctica TaxID=1109128 RepID=G8IQP2_GONAN|nr:NADH dehydrogenase subunit 1 [Gondogeneia antarctica]